ncbi:precorrin-2 dehydrogenase/sirohydrochlorin ferrochelatase family protein [Melghirimyces algeriensis]|uniref:precorrin-2 dehydrogenase n=1 Tax=Melghirimyces algeriensis TaxID=910412 RepID=A0A521AFG8_9BACL|nr:NAD(P)-dependent oxidoreductase [Melghirimyces algeriensis]SMO33565.1 precorrin-2 dehydrogenase / sirohydrochlorin ferrochelatase [Melghirimyces algeriensis]
MSHVPVMINLKDKPAIVIGAGDVAFRKVQWLLEAGANVTVIAPEGKEELQALEDEGRIGWKKKCFDPDDIWEAWMIIAATDSAKINREVAEAAGFHQLVNIVDQSDLGNLCFPAKLNRGRLTLAVSTGGASPHLAGKIRDELAEQFDENWEKQLEWLYKKRKEIKDLEVNEEKRKEALKHLVDQLWDNVTRGNPSG